MYSDLQTIYKRPVVWSVCSTETLLKHCEVGQHRLANHPFPGLGAAARRMATIDATVKWVTSRFNTTGASLCDLGCGTGLYTQRFARAGMNVTGVDLSANALAHARRGASRNGILIAYHRANYLDWDSEQSFDLVTLMLCDFCSLSPEQRTRLLRRIKRYLKPGGRLLIDVYSIEAFAKRIEQQRVERNQDHYAGVQDDYYAIVSTFVYPEERVSLDKYSIYEKSGGRRTLLHWQQYFCPLMLANELEVAGFTVAERLSDLAGRSYRPDVTEFAVVCRHTNT